MQEQRDLPALRALIDKLLDNGWTIIGRDPLQLRSGRRTYLVMHGMLISEGQREPAQVKPRPGIFESRRYLPER
jgi:hypothetical protein